MYVDGVRVDNGGGFTYAGAGGGGTPSRLDDINPETIERVEILKGAAAATLYGSEANAGVIQIFTKKGSQGRPQFTFKVEAGLARYPDAAMKPIAGFARYATTADCAAAGNTATACATTIGVADRLSAIFHQPVTPYQVFEQDLINQLFGTGYNTTYSGSITGGGETAIYNVAARLSREDGPIDVGTLDRTAGGNDFNRKYHGSATITLFPRERFQLRAGAMFTDVHHETPNNGNNIYGVVSSAINSKPEVAQCEESRKQGIGGAFGGETGRDDDRRVFSIGADRRHDIVAIGSGRCRGRAARRAAVAARQVRPGGAARVRERVSHSFGGRGHPQLRCSPRERGRCHVLAAAEASRGSQAEEAAHRSLRHHSFHRGNRRKVAARQRRGVCRSREGQNSPRPSCRRRAGGGDRRCVPDGMVFVLATVKLSAAAIGLHAIGADDRRRGGRKRRDVREKWRNPDGPASRRAAVPCRGPSTGRCARGPNRPGPSAR